MTVAFLAIAGLIDVAMCQPAAAAAQQPNPKAAEPARAAEQPLPFSHKSHIALELQCKYCHVNPEPGNQMTLPATEKCMACHGTIAKDKPAIQKLAEFAKSDKPVPWVRVYSVPGFVYWSHQTHSDAGMKCESCHGDVAQMDVMRKVTNVTTMGGCVDCHRKNGASTGCETCHESQSSQWLSVPGVTRPGRREMGWPGSICLR